MFTGWDGIIYNATEIKVTTQACNLDIFQDDIAFFSGMFCVLGFANFLGFFGSTALFGISGERLTTRLRRKCFNKLLNMEMSYFDDPLNTTGALTTRLSTDASKVQGDYFINFEMQTVYYAPSTQTNSQ
jgi:ABC-type multidrug transport system fused ATPase/permease subunit